MSTRKHAPGATGAWFGDVAAAAVGGYGTQIA
jgi:hypothetical protein